MAKNHRKAFVRTVADGLIRGGSYGKKGAMRRAQALAEVLELVGPVNFKELRRTLRDRGHELESDPEATLLDLLATTLDDETASTHAGEPHHTFFGIDVFVALTVTAADVARVAHLGERHDVADEVMRRLSGLALSVQRQAPSWEPGQLLGDVIGNVDYPDRPVSMLYLHEEEVDDLAKLIQSMVSFLADARDDETVSVPPDLLDVDLLGHGGPARARAGCTCMYCYADTPEAFDAPTAATLFEGTAQRIEDLGELIWDDSRPAGARPFCVTAATLGDLSEAELLELDAELEAELRQD